MTKNQIFSKIDTYVRVILHITSMTKLLKPNNLQHHLRTWNECYQRSLYLAPPFLVGDYEPKACKTFREGKMAEKVNLAVKELENCVACPRNCKVNRLENKKGACNTGRYYFFEMIEIHSLAA